jgi:hypothetical protein
VVATATVPPASRAVPERVELHWPAHITDGRLRPRARLTCGMDRVGQRQCRGATNGARIADDNLVAWEDGFEGFSCGLANVVGKLAEAAPGGIERPPPL